MNHISSTSNTIPIMAFASHRPQATGSRLHGIQATDHDAAPHIRQGIQGLDRWQTEGLYVYVTCIRHVSINTFIYIYTVYVNIYIYINHYMHIYVNDMISVCIIYIEYVYHICVYIYTVSTSLQYITSCGIPVLSGSS